MKKHQENPTRGGQNYVSPELTCLEIESEGIFCGSPNFTTPTWERDDDSLDW